MNISTNTQSLQLRSEALNRRMAAYPTGELTADYSTDRSAVGYPPQTGKLLGYAMTQRQQVAAYAVVDSMGRGLTQTVGSAVSLFA